MPIQKPISLEEARQKKQQLAQQEQEKTDPTPPQPAAVPGNPAEPVDNPHQEEEEDLLKKYAEEDSEEDPDQKAAREVKEKNAAKKNKTKRQKVAEMPSVKNRVRTSEGKKGKTRPCKRCKNPHTFGDPRSKYCPMCAKIVAAEAAMEGAGAP